MRRGHEEAQPRGCFFHGGIQDRLHVDAALAQRLADLQAVQRVPQDGGDDGAAAGEPRVDAALAREPEEQSAALVQPLHLLRMRLDLPERL